MGQWAYLIPKVMAEGESSDGEEEAEAVPSARGACGQFVWPCPREYPATIAARKKKKWLIPADMSKEDVGKLFKQVLAKCGQGPEDCSIHLL
jgi:hypothetical protein